MPLFKRRSGGTPTVTFDPAMGDERVKAAVEALERGNWRSVHGAWATLEDPDATALLVMAARGVPFPDAWAEAEPDHPLPWLLRGSRRTLEAWEARGSGMAETVSEGGWNSFHGLLNRAEEDLNRSAVLAPDDPTPWSALMITAMGLSLGENERQRRFAELRRRAPASTWGFDSATRSLTEKWGASHDAMFAVAAAAQELPEGAEARVSVFIAHYEMWLWLLHFDKDTKAADAYWKQPHVVADVERAALGSVLSAHHVRTPLTRLAQSHAAYALALTGEAEPRHRVLAASLFDQLGDADLPEPPWEDRFGAAKAAAGFERFRAACRSSSTG
jgi:hypothetical protein